MRPTFRIDYANELNDAQYRAVTTIDGPQLVIAGAGTGKTRTLIYRVAYLVEHGVQPDTVLLLTFTRKAAQEMMYRAAQILDERCTKVSGGTFHSFANMILRSYASYFGFNSRFTIMDRSDAEDILSLLRAEFSMAHKHRRFPRKRALLNIISRTINTGRTHEEIVAAEYPQFMDELDDIEKLHEAYIQYKLKHSVMDYDDLLVYFYRLLTEYEAVRQELSQYYRYIMVDEFQDTNRLQAEIAYQLADDHRNIMVVGDDAQSIYSFRGADFRNIMDFPKRFPDCVITTLEQNYRSSQSILSLTNAIIQSAQEKYSKSLYSDIPSEGKPKYIRPKSDQQQAFFVTREIAELIRQGVVPGDIAVLFRAGWHSNTLEIALNRSGLPYLKYGGIKFIESAHIKDVLAILRVVFNPHDAVSWHRLLLLMEGIGSVTAQKIIAQITATQDRSDTLTSARLRRRKYGAELRKLNDLLNILDAIDDPAQQVSQAIEYYRPIMEQKFDDAHKRINDLHSLAQISENYHNLETLLADLTLESPEKHVSYSSPDRSENDRIVLSTIHSAKGLEWDTVFLIHLVDGLLPSSYAFFDHAALEEERRLFYVATTRAKRKLYLSAPQIAGRHHHDGISSQGPSRFLYEIGKLSALTERI